LFDNNFLGATCSSILTNYFNNSDINIVNSREISFASKINKMANENSEYLVIEGANNPYEYKRFLDLCDELIILCSDSKLGKTSFEKSKINKKMNLLVKQTEKPALDYKELQNKYIKNVWTFKQKNINKLFSNARETMLFSCIDNVIRYLKKKEQKENHTSIFDSNNVMQTDNFIYRLKKMFIKDEAFF
jgi:hypothetical protein